MAAPNERTSARVARLLALVVVLAAAPHRAAAQAPDYSGDYVLNVDGHTVLALTLKQGANGQLGGSVAAAGKSLPLAGVVRDGKLLFTSSSRDGRQMQWEGTPHGDSLAVLLVPPGPDGRPNADSAQAYTLVRRAEGQSASLLQKSQYWVAMLITIADSVASWCGGAELGKQSLCKQALKIHQKIAPALFVSRLAAGGAGPRGRVATAAVQTTSAGSVAPLRAAATPQSAPAAANDDGPGAALPSARPADAPSTSLARSLLGGTSSAQAVSGRYVMAHGGQELLAITLASGAGGRLTGNVSAGGSRLPLSGTVANGTVEFTTRSPDGRTGRWQGSVQGDELAVTLTAPEGTERYVLTRRAVTP